jgi:hypothetical protein
MAGSVDTSLLQPFPFSIVHAYSHSVCTSNWVSSQAKPLSPTLPPLHNYTESSIAILTHSRHQVAGTTREPSQLFSTTLHSSTTTAFQRTHRLPNEHSLPSNTPHHTHDRIPHRQPSLLPSQTGGVRSLKEHSFVPYTRQPVDLFCHHAERTVRRRSPAVNPIPGLPPCAHDPDRIGDYPTL